MKKLGILMALFVMSCGLLLSSVSAEPVRLPQIGDNSIDYDSETGKVNQITFEKIQ
mgnify:CR=1 FL=1